MNDKGVELYNRALEEALSGNWAAAHKQLISSISEGNADAMHALGICYRDGNGLRKNYRKARQWLRRAARIGNTESMLRLAILCENGKGGNKDLNQARRLYRSAHSAGNNDATTELGRLYYWGIGVRKNHQKARSFFEKAAVANEEAAYWFALMLRRGEGGDRDELRAKIFFEKLSNQQSEIASRATEALKELEE